ncbi:DUF423 domain-containing protein [Neptunicella sp. SCSIO 80796]|uniref:DUF423 domain-containing protein n=1 Tax=Neptunicella plasticusilytica TaxID=3117012 RepID=UPI003A4D233C
MNRYLAVAAFLAFIAVVAGAFGAHGLKTILSASELSSWQTAVRFQFFHCLGVILLVILYRQQTDRLLRWSANFMLAGMLLFSGSIYLLLLTGIKWLGPVTPIGGLCLMISWLILVVSSVRKN